MPIRMITVGKLLDPWTQAAREYEKRISRYDKLESIEVADLKEPAQLSDAAIAEHRRREGEVVLKRIKPTDYVVALCIDAKQYSSEAFAAKLGEWRVGGKTPCFVIGGSMGLSDEVLSRAHERLSLSALTFPHQMARVVLLEQVYRAFKILGQERYHK